MTGRMRAGLAVLVAVVAVAWPAAGNVTPCSVDALQSDVRSSLVGSIEVSNLRVSWRTGNEGADLAGYAVWARQDDSARRLAFVLPSWSCPHVTTREVVVPWDPTLEYLLELRLRDGSSRMLPIPVR